MLDATHLQWRLSHNRYMRSCLHCPNSFLPFIQNAIRCLVRLSVKFRIFYLLFFSTWLPIVRTNLGVIFSSFKCGVCLTKIDSLSLYQNVHLLPAISFRVLVKGHMNGHCNFTFFYFLCKSEVKTTIVERHYYLPFM